MSPFAREFGPEPTETPECTAFLERIQIALDGEASMGSVFENPHAEVCASCRRTAMLARGLQQGVVSSVESPPGLADRIFERAMDDRQIRIRLRWAAAAGLATLAAGVLIATYPTLTGSSPVPNPSQATVFIPSNPPEPVRNPPRFDDRIADAGTAIASISRKAQDQTVTPTKNFFPQSPSVGPPKSSLPPEVEPAAVTIAEIPQNAKSGLEPVTSSTLRAFNLFLRDTGVGPSTKPKS